MADRDQIVADLDELLEVDRFEDWGPNGLQVPGRGGVHLLASGVSASLELIEAAIAKDADMLIVHHGLFWASQPRALSEQMAARLRAALGHGLSVAAYHLPLDGHPELGNNALLRSMLMLEPDPRPFGIVKGRPIGAIGTWPDPRPAEELFGRVERATRREPLIFDAGPELVGSVGIVSGAGSKEIAAAVELGLDALITGEPAEHAMADAREGGIHFIAAGHYATETFGVRALGELCASRYGVEHLFIDVPNPI